MQHLNTGLQVAATLAGTMITSFGALAPGQQEQHPGL